ncbi:MAG TPA: ATP-binding protein [Pirellulales bacterium]|jgi:signal transduction histidine kinase|nr:ATP-binding protein [Pirellulales bacterium]
MSLRAKLLLAQLPLALALVLLGVVAVWRVSALSHQSELILKDNYRSVLAAQRMKESIERLDSAAIFIVAGERNRAEPQIAEHRNKFAAELQVQENNITEFDQREDVATKTLRDAWTKYEGLLTDYLKLTDLKQMNKQYFDILQPQFVVVKDDADEILQINEIAMQRKADAALRAGQLTNSIVAAVAIGALVVGALASILLTQRLLRPLSLLTMAVNRLGQKDFAARALVMSRDEIGQLATQFNLMAEHLQEYRESSLGELLLAQRASQATIDSIPDPVIVFNAEGNILKANGAADSLWQTNGLEPDSKTLVTLPPAVRSALDRAKAHVLQGKGAFLPNGFEDAFDVPSAEGHRWFLLRANPVYEDEGKITGATAILQDVTRLRRLDELKNNLVATVAHEFRTPLTSLRMAVHLCLEGVAGPLTDKQADLLHAAREECERLQATVDELLDLARIQSGRMEMELQPVAAAKLIEEAVVPLHGAAAEKQIQLQAESLLIHEQVMADVERIQIVFHNLIANALRHTPDRGIVRVRGIADDSAVRFEISDTGEGIPKEYHAAIFERFFRIPGSSAGAAGLGLSLCKEIVEAHGGRIGVESQPGHGSTFWFTLRATGSSPGSA